MIVPCQYCGIEFYVRPSGLKRGGGKFCSHQCDANFRRPSPEEYTSRYWSLVDTALGQGPKGDCWGWRGKFNSGGYAILGYPHNRALPAHRFSYVLTYGEFSPELHVLHQCDNPPCTNPEHLFLGTQTTNNVDKLNKGRQASILNAEQVREMRALYDGGMKIKPLCERFGVKRHCVGGIVHRRFWRHVN